MEKKITLRGLSRFGAAALFALAPLTLPAQPFAPEPPAPEPQAQTRVVRLGGGGSFIGVGVQEVDADRAKTLKLKEEAGVEITRIEDDSPAAKAGLKVNDVILQYHGQRVEGIEQFSRFVRETPPGREVKMLIVRDGNNQTVVAKIAARKGMPGSLLPAMPRIEMPNMPDMPRVYTMWRSSMLGVEGEGLQGQLAEFFGVKEGVLVRAVLRESPAEKAGIKAGDVILKVNDVKVASPNDIGSAIRSLKEKKTVPVVLIRDKKEMTVNATVEPDRSGFDFGSPGVRISRRGFRM